MVDMDYGSIDSKSIDGITFGGKKSCLPPKRVAVDGQTNEINFIQFVCLSLNLVDFSSKLVCLSSTPERGMLTARLME